MTVSPTARFNLPKWSVGADPWPQRTGWNQIIQAIDDLAAQGLAGLPASRPAAGVPNRYFWDTFNLRFYVDDGTQWTEVSPVGGGGTPSASGPGASGSEGNDRRSARSNHIHPYVGQYAVYQNDVSANVPDGDWTRLNIAGPARLVTSSGTVLTPDGADVSYVTVTKAGLYDVFASVSWAINGTGNRYVGVSTSISSPGVHQQGMIPAPNGSEAGRVFWQGPVPMTSAGRIYFWAYQSSGGPLAATSRRMSVEYRG